MENKETPIFVETKEGVKDIKDITSSTKPDYEESGEFSTKDFIVPCKINVFKATLIDDDFIKEFMKQAKCVLDPCYELVTYKDKFTTQTLTYIEEYEDEDEEGNKELVKEAISLNTKTLVESDGYNEESETHIVIHRGDKIARYNGQFIVISDGKLIDARIQEAIKVLKEV